MPSAPATRSKRRAGAFSKATVTPSSSCSRPRTESPNRISAPVTSRSSATRSPRMISTELGSRARMSTRATARSAASTNLMPSTSAVSARTRGMIPIRSATSPAWPRTSTPFPPVRSAAARSTMTGRKPCRPSQWARVRPAMLAPEIRIRSFILEAPPARISETCIPLDYVEGAFQLSTHAGTRCRADAVRNRQLALGAATVVRAFGGKDALLDAAVSRLLEPVVQRARDLLAETTPYQALRTFLGELIAFQAAHHAVNDYLGGLDLPATTALRVGLVAAVEEMLDGARRDGAIRTDLDPAVVRTLIEQTAPAIASARPPSPALADAYLTVLLD